MNTRNLFSATFAPIWGGVKETYHQTVAFVKFIKQSELGQNIPGMAKDFGKGMIAIANKNIFSVLKKSEDLRQVAARSLYLNFDFICKILLLEHSKSVANDLIPGYEQSYWSSVVNFAASMYLLRLSITNQVDNTVYNMAIVDHACKFRPTNATQPNSWERIKSLLIAMPYGVAMDKVCSILPSNPLIQYPCKFRLMGQAIHTPTFNANNIQTAQRAEIAAHNNTFLMGLGASFYTAYAAGNFLLQYIANEESAQTISPLIFQFLLQYFMINSLLEQKPLPGKLDNLGFDWFKLTRYITRKSLDKSFKLAKPGIKHFIRNFPYSKIHAVNDYPPTQLIRNVLLESGFQTWDDFLKTETGREFGRYYRQNIYIIIDWIIFTNGSYVAKCISKFVKRFPEGIVSSAFNNTVEVALTKQLPSFIVELNKKLGIDRDFLDLMKWSFIENVPLNEEDFDTSIEPDNLNEESSFEVLPLDKIGLSEFTNIDSEQLNENQFDAIIPGDEMDLAEFIDLKETITAKEKVNKKEKTLSSDSFILMDKKIIDEKEPPLKAHGFFSNLRNKLQKQPVIKVAEKQLKKASRLLK